MRFKNKVIIVTGGARGIGAETTVQLAKEGASIAIFDVNEALSETILPQITSLGVKAMA
jgi:3-oxoacyl-[acyl-carrier protein] reductase